MLVLSRKTGEEIVIGRNISVVVRRISGNRVAIGIEAPRGVRVLRGELQPFAEAFGEVPEDEADASGSVIAPPVSGAASRLTVPTAR